MFRRYYLILVLGLCHPFAFAQDFSIFDRYVELPVQVYQTLDDMLNDRPMEEHFIAKPFRLRKKDMPHIDTAVIMKRIYKSIRVWNLLRAEDRSKIPLEAYAIKYGGGVYFNLRYLKKFNNRNFFVRLDVVGKYSMSFLNEGIDDPTSQRRSMPGYYGSLVGGWDSKWYSNRNSSGNRASAVQMENEEREIKFHSVY